MNSQSSMSHGVNVLLAALLLSAGLLLVAPVRATAQARASSASSASSKATRVKFMRGAYSAQVRGQLTKNKNASARFVVNARAGEHMLVNIIPLTRGLLTGGEVMSPSGQQEGQHGGLIFDAVLTESGDYAIRVDRNLMGTERADGAFILEVVITPASMKN